MALGLDEARAALASGDEEARRAAVAGLDVDPAGPSGAAALALLVTALGDPSWRVRKEAAIRAAGWTARAQAAAALARALAEPENVGRRNAAIEALAAIGAEAVPPLILALAARPEHRKVLVDTLGLIGDPAGAPAVAGLLDDADPNVRVAAAEALGLMGGPQAEAALLRALEAWQGDRLLTLAALDALNRLGAEVPIERLRPLTDDPTLKAAALGALGRTGAPDAPALLAQAIVDGARSVREAAMVALAELDARLGPGAGAREALERAPSGDPWPFVVTALLEGTAGVQRAAARLLGLGGRPEAVRPLALAVGDPEIRQAALEALEALGPSMIAELTALAPDLEGRLRGEIYALLPRLGEAARDPRVTALLREGLGDEEPESAAQAAAALGEVGGREALGPLLRALGRGEVASAAAHALGRLGARHYDEVRILVASRGLAGPEGPHLCRVLGACGHAEDAPPLKAALGAESPELRRAAAEALAELPLGPHAEEVTEALLFALADEAAEVRAQAAHALGAHAEALPPAAADALERAARDLEPAVRTQAARALGALAIRTGPREARPAVALRRLCEAADPVAAVPALAALGALGDPADGPRLFAALESPDPEIVKAAAHALGERAGGLQAAEARAALERALTDRRWDVRRAAALALGEHGPEAHPLLYARKTVERDPLVIAALDQAMGQAMGHATKRGGDLG